MSLKSGAFLESIIAFLLPYFIAGATGADPAHLRAEIIETLADYATRTRAELLQAAQIIALGMTTLDVLAEAKTTEMSQSMRARYRSCANGLNRSTLNTEKALDRRLADDAPLPTDIGEPLNDLPDQEVEGAIDHAQAAIDAYRGRLSTTQSRPHPDDRFQHLTDGALLYASGQLNAPAPAAPD